MIQPWRRRCVLIWLLALAAGQVSGLPADRRPSQYVHDAWTKEDGLPLDMVGAVQQTPDGYLWLATQQGVARYDGLNFTVYDALSVPAYPHKQAETVHAHGDSLWIGGSNGIALLHEGQAVCWDRGVNAPSAMVQVLRALDNGRVYAGTSNGLTWLQDVGCLGVRHWSDALDTVADFNVNPGFIDEPQL